MKEYALYKGEEILAIGTADEIAEELGILKKTVWYYGTPSQHKRTSGTNARVLIPLDEEEVI